MLHVVYYIKEMVYKRLFMRVVDGRQSSVSSYDSITRTFKKYGMMRLELNSQRA
jgi:hypothetical protein